MMNAQDPLSMYELGKRRVAEQIELREFDRDVRAAGPNSVIDALRRRLSVLLVRLSGWVYPAGAAAAAKDAAQIRPAR